MKTITPPALKKHGHIGCFAPASYCDPDAVQSSKNRLESLGYHVFVHEQAMKRHNQSAGTHDDKLGALSDLFTNPDIQAIITAGGGNRCLHLLDKIDFSLIAANPKNLMGYSDVTALLNAVYAKTGLKTFYGPMMNNIAKLSDADISQCLHILGGEAVQYDITAAKTLRTGRGTGPLIGGCLSVFHALIGTAYMPDTDGAILFFEDVNEEHSNIDRMLYHMRLGGLFDNIQGLVFGEFLNMQDTGRPYGFSIKDIILEATNSLNIPIIINAPFGHGQNMMTLPIGQEAKLSVEEHDISLNLI